MFKLIFALLGVVGFVVAVLVSRKSIEEKLTLPTQAKPFSQTDRLSKKYQTSLQKTVPPIDFKFSHFEMPKCSEVTDQVCAELWSAKYDGNMPLENGEAIWVGKSSRGSLPQKEFLDLEALVHNEAKLPEDLREEGNEVLKDLESLLANEEQPKDWDRKLQEVLQRWKWALEDVASARTRAKNHEWADVEEEERTLEQKSTAREEYDDLLNEVTRAKYENHPNWIRVKRVFVEAQKDILEEIQQLEISQELKDRMLQGVASVELSLPIYDPRVGLSIEGCDSTVSNAYYFPSSHKFTVCAGYFNSYQSDVALYGTAAHEMSHSIDTYRIQRPSYEDTPVERALAPFLLATGPVYTCEEWRTLKEEVLGFPTEVSTPTHPYQKLIECLSSTEKLKEFSLSNLKSVSEASTSGSMSGYAKSYSFTRLAQSEVEKKGKVIANEVFLRPDRLFASQHKGIFPSSLNKADFLSGVFVQSLFCQKSNGGDGFVDQLASKDVKSEVFSKALQETQELAGIRFLNEAMHYGRESRNLLPYKMSHDLSEYFADWMANRALVKYLSRQGLQSSMRIGAAVSTVKRCMRPGPSKDAPYLTGIEKRYSLESHPEERRRRLAVFTPKLAKLIGCELDDEIIKAGINECDF